MAWSWVWIGAALVTGCYLGMTLMSLLIIAQQTSERPRNDTLGRARLPRTTGQHRGTA